MSQLIRVGKLFLVVGMFKKVSFQERHIGMVLNGIMFYQLVRFLEFSQTKNPQRNGLMIMMSKPNKACSGRDRAAPLTQIVYNYPNSIL